MGRARTEDFERGPIVPGRTSQARQRVRPNRSSSPPAEPSRRAGKPSCLDPVRLIGRSLSWLEGVLRASGAEGRLGGCQLFAALVVSWGGGCAVLLISASEVHSLFAAAFHLITIYSLVALGDLFKHASAVERAAEARNLAGARRAIGKLVGRDAERMDAAACRRASIESLAGNLGDGFVSPIFWYAVAGVPGIVLFKISARWIR